MIRSRAVSCAIFLSITLTCSVIAPGECEGFKYESRGKRDPFVPLVGIDRPVVSRLEEIASIGDIKLEGIATDPKSKIIAILNGEIVREGDRFGEIEVNKITEKSVTILIGGKRYDIDLTEEGGVKGGK